MQIVYKLNGLTPEEIKNVEDLPVRSRMQTGAPHRQAGQDIFRHKRSAIPAEFWRIYLLRITGKAKTIFGMAIIQRVKESNCLNMQTEAGLLLVHVAEFWGQQEAMYV